MTDTLTVRTPTEPGLTPNTRSEAEAALTYNALLQTASAGKPQATTPTVERPSLYTRDSSNYATAAGAASLSAEPPYPSESAEAIRGNLSRGTTQAVLEKMASPTSPPPQETLLSKRASREGERRTSQVAADGGRPGVYSRQSYNQEDLKRVMSEKLMQLQKGSGEATGYDSVP